jgi:hypothetical protein
MKDYKTSELVTIQEAAGVLAVSEQRVHQMIDEGKLECGGIGKFRFPVRKSLKALEAERRREGRSLVW